MRESVIKVIGGLCYKFVFPGRRRMPEGIVLLPPTIRGGESPVHTISVEFKATGKKVQVRPVALTFAAEETRLPCICGEFYRRVNLFVGVL